MFILTYIQITTTLLNFIKTSSIKSNTPYKWKGRTIIIYGSNKYELFDIDLVVKGKLLTSKEVKRIDI